MKDLKDLAKMFAEIEKADLPVKTMLICPSETQTAMENYEDLRKFAKEYTKNEENQRELTWIYKLFLIASRIFLTSLCTSMRIFKIN